MEVEVQDELKRLRLELSLVKRLKPLLSPDGSEWVIVVSDAGILTAVKK